MDWTRSDTLGIAAHDCTCCHGLGLRGGRIGENQPCNCVLRSIFRVCYRKFTQVALQEKRMSKVTLDGAGAQCRRTIWGRKDEEYMIDFLNIAKKTLDENDHRIFRLHYLLGADWRLCCANLGMDKGLLFHTLYRIEQKLGRVFKELQPYALFPVDQYYGGVKVEHKGTVLQFRAARPVEPPALVKRRQEEAEAEAAKKPASDFEWDMDEMPELKAA